SRSFSRCTWLAPWWHASPAIPARVTSGPSVADTGRLLIVGPLPPPYHGVAVATQALCSVLERQAVGFTLVDIADRRGLANIGRIDWGNITAALRHGGQFVRALVRSAPRVVLVPISQNRPGFLRDCLFLVPARLTRKRLVLHLHGSDFRRFYDTSPAILRWLI